eukprot:170418-Rhodomonas_salina.2
MGCCQVARWLVDEGEMEGLTVVAFPPPRCAMSGANTAYLMLCAARRWHTISRAKHSSWWYLAKRVLHGVRY